MKFPTKVLTLSLMCMNMVLGGLDSYPCGDGPIKRSLEKSYLTTYYDNNKMNYVKNKPYSKPFKKSRNNKHTQMKPEDIKELKEYVNLDKACKELNNLLRNKVIKDFREIPSETAIKVDSAIRNILELIFPKDKIYSSEYWIQKIIENPEDDYEDSDVEGILRHPLEYTDDIDGGTCDYTAAKILYSLAPYLNGNKISNIDARSVFGQMMLKLTTEEKLKKLALRMIFSSLFSGDIAAYNFLIEYAYDFLIKYGLKKDLKSLYDSIKKETKNYNIYFEDEKLKDLIQNVKRHYIYICEEYLN